jgi:hypothetical protein
MKRAIAILKKPRQLPSRTTFDVLDIFAVLNTAHVEYLVFGGLAVILYGVGRVTWDVDLIVHLTVSNVKRLAQALHQIGFKPRVPADPAGLADPKIRRDWIEKKGMKVYSFIDDQFPPRNVDVMVRPPKDFGALYERCKIVEVRGVPIPLVPVQTLVKLKRAAGRLQDMQDVEDLGRLGLI